MKLEHILELSQNPQVMTDTEIGILLPQVRALVALGHTGLVEKILPKKPLINNEAIVAAIGNGHLDMVKMLFEKGYIIKPFSDFDEERAFYRFLHTALMKGQDEWVALINQYCPGVIDVNQLMTIALEKTDFASTQSIWTNPIPFELSLPILEKIAHMGVDFQKIKISDYAKAGRHDDYQLMQYLFKNGRTLKENDIDKYLDDWNAEGLACAFSFKTDLKNGEIYFVDEKINLLDLIERVYQHRNRHKSIGGITFSDRFIFSILQSLQITKENLHEVMGLSSGTVANSQRSPEVIRDLLYFLDNKYEDIQRSFEAQSRRGNDANSWMVREELNPDQIKEAENKEVPLHEAYVMSIKTWDNARAGNLAAFSPEDIIRKTYDELLPDIMLLCLCEGISHVNYCQLITEKLAFLFRSKEKAFDYLKKFQDEYPRSKMPIHDACDFNLPKKGIWNVSLWSSIISHLGFAATRFLPWAPRVETEFSIAGKPLWCLKNEWFNEEKRAHFDELKANYTKEAEVRFTKGDVKSGAPGFFAVQGLEKMEQSVLKKVNLELTTRVNNRLREALDAQFRSDPALSAVSRTERAKKVDFYLKRANLSTMSVDDLATHISDIGYARTAENRDFARQCILSGIDEEDFDRCLAILATPKVGDNIPEVLIDGDDLGYPKCYLKKLPANDPLGFLLGAKTSCCQSIGSQGEACAMHGMTSENGGFYVLFEKETQKVLAQTWAWVSSKPTHLVFDTLEFLPRVDEEMVRRFFQAAAQKILTTSKYTQIAVGLGGHTPLIDNAQYVIPADSPVDYDDYRESEVQIILATKEALTDLDQNDFSQLEPSDAYDMLIGAVRKGDQRLARALLVQGIREPGLAQKIAKGDYFLYSEAPLLLTCIETENIDMFKMLLLEFQVNPNIHDGALEYPLYVAARLGQTEMCHLLCENPETILVYKKSYGQLGGVPYNHPDERPSYLAAHAGHRDLADYLEQKEAEYLERMEQQNPSTGFMW